MLEKLLTPKTVAVIGASRTPGKVGHDVLANLIEGRFEGKIVPVNPSGEDILGIPCYKDLKDYPDKIDLSVIAVPVKSVRAAIDSSINAGAKAITVITAGFKEVGHEGAVLENELAQICRANGVRLMGPNCLGLINSHHKMNASFAPHMPDVGSISVISQSGALAAAILDWASGRNLGLGKVISIGNKADVDETDLLEALAEDPDTKVIVAYLESIITGSKFVRVAQTTASVKPVIILKAGTSSAGLKAASSHTGSLAGADTAYGAAFMRAGVIRADDFEALFDTATAMAMQPLPKGDRVAIITNAGGPGIMAADAVEHSGMVVAPLTNGLAEKLKGQLPPAASVANPIDVLGDAPPERYVAALDAAQADDGIDAIVVILTPQAMTKPVETAQAIAQNASGKKPVLMSFMGGRDVQGGREALGAANLPDYPSPERAVAALKDMCDYSAWLRRPPRVVARFPVNRRRVERIIARYLRHGRKQVREVEAKEMLRAYGFHVGQGALARSAEEAVDVARHVGFPVVMKVVSPDVIHKSDIGGVKLNLHDPEAVLDAFDVMMVRIRRHLPDARIDGAYVESMGSRGREVILGMTRDPQFGPMLMFGLGGIFVEVMKDVAFHLAPITEDEALQMLKTTRSYALLEGARGQAGVDLHAIAMCLQRISQLATDFPQVSELDINPLIVGEFGTEPLVADARMTLSNAGAKS
ncbi:MAG: acetate--CoA ligase family protein [Phycisphaerae bacterium]|nr:acetate--CoA ligase family protein [Phycisphaerae bacterium]